MRPKYTIGDYVFHKARKDIECSVVCLIKRNRYGRVEYWGVLEYLSDLLHVEPSFLGYEGELYDSFEEAWAACRAEINAELARPRHNFAEVLNRRIASGAPCAKELRSKAAAEKSAALAAEKARNKAEREAKKAVPVL